MPKTLFDEGLDAYVVRELGLPFHDVDWDEWEDLLERVHHPKHEVNIAIVGKYIDLPDAYLSVTEAIKAGGFANYAKVNVKWVAADKCETEEGAAAALDQVDGIVIPGGFGIRGIDGKIGALKYARENKLPALGLCLGLQSMVIEYSRHVLGIEDANSSEFEPDCSNPGHRHDGGAEGHRRRPRRHGPHHASGQLPRPSWRRTPSLRSCTAPRMSPSATATAMR